MADFHTPDVRRSAARVVTYRSYDYERAPDPAGELRAALLAALDDAGSRRARRASRRVTSPTPSPTGSSRPVAPPVACDAAVQVDARASRRSDGRAASPTSCSRPSRTTPRRASARRRSQGSRPAAMFREAGRRVPAILTVTTGRRRRRPAAVWRPARDRQPGDLVLSDTSPWIDGALVGHRERRLRRRRPTGRRAARFDAMRRALARGDRALPPRRRRLRRRPPRCAPSWPSTGRPTATTPATASAPRGRSSRASRRTASERLEEGMVLALEPAIYLPGWGGIRLEHTFVVGAERQRDPDRVRAHAVKVASRRADRRQRPVHATARSARRSRATASPTSS